MANTNDNDVALTWDAGSSSKSLNSNTTRFASDARSVHADAVSASLRVLIDNSGTPASGDTVDLWIAWSPDAAAFDTEEHAQPLGRLDSFGTNDPGEDPAAKTFALDVSGFQSFKLLARANQGATRAITISAIYNEHRSA